MWIRVISFNKMTGEVHEGIWNEVPNSVVDRLEEEVKKPEKGLVFWLERQLSNGDKHE